MTHAYSVIELSCDPVPLIKKRARVRKPIGNVYKREGCTKIPGVRTS